MRKSRHTTSEVRPVAQVSESDIRIRKRRPFSVEHPYKMDTYPRQMGYRPDISPPIFQFTIFRNISDISFFSTLFFRKGNYPMAEYAEETRRVTDWNAQSEILAVLRHIS